jgi:hypothetical protein
MPGLFVLVPCQLSGADGTYRKPDIAAFIDLDHDLSVCQLGNNGPLHKDTTSQ